MVLQTNTTKSGKTIQDNFGFTYRLTYIDKAGRISWKCSKRDVGCKAYLVTFEETIIKRQYDHSNHWKFEK